MCETDERKPAGNNKITCRRRWTVAQPRFRFRRQSDSLGQTPPCQVSQVLSWERLPPWRRDSDPALSLAQKDEPSEVRAGSCFAFGVWRAEAAGGKGDNNRLAGPGDKYTVTDTVRGIQSLAVHPPAEFLPLTDRCWQLKLVESQMRQELGGVLCNQSILLLIRVKCSCAT